MNSYKCPQCGLTNWLTTETCKRCRMPNPYSNQPNNFQPVMASPSAVGYNNPTAQPFTPQQSPPPSMMPNYAVPPPPTVFGSAVGTSANDVGFGYQNQPAATNFERQPPIRGGRGFNQNFYSPEVEEKLKAAEKQIRDAWISGVVVCCMTALIAILVPIFGVSSAYIQATVIEMVVSLIICGGLTVGVYYKSRACAVLLFGFYVLDKIVSIASAGVNIGGLFLSFLFIYYFALGIQGTFTYYKLKNQR